MSCMKCGRDIEEGQVFCPDCLAVMERYPVKPGIAIQLPGKKEHPVQKKAHVKRRQPPAPEEVILKLKRRLKMIVILWLVTLLLLAATIYPTVEFIRDHALPQLGQNYTTITDSSGDAP